MATNDPQVVLIQLGIMLRRLRNAADLPASAAANHLDCSIAKISKMENGKQRILPSEVSSLLEIYGADDSQTAEALRLATVPKPRRRGTYRDSVPDWFRRFIVLESEAAELLIYEFEVIAGLLQTKNYARALLEAGNPLASHRDIDQQVEMRMNRKSVLTKDDAPFVDIVLHEAALHRVIGGDDVMREQLEHLRELADLSNVRLHVVPFRPAPTPTKDEAFVAKAAFVLLKLESTGAVVYVEDVVSANYPEEANVIKEYAAAFQRLRNASLSVEESSKLIGKVASQYT
ncbi:helix-turn-helix transcriptional regulator [Saccharopolyspora shandongensis]|uniref:helix-turn-helix domain-containing protein n=1 Tax=Saccharopolyspora shandongensis TaxID=418495 RepID=UPI00344A38DF